MLRRVIIAVVLAVSALLAGAALALPAHADVIDCHHGVTATPGNAATSVAATMHREPLSASTNHSRLRDCCTGTGVCTMSSCTATMTSAEVGPFDPSGAAETHLLPRQGFALRGQSVPPPLGPPRGLPS